VWRRHIPAAVSVDSWKNAELLPDSRHYGPRKLFSEQYHQNTKPNLSLFLILNGKSPLRKNYLHSKIGFDSVTSGVTKAGVGVFFSHRPEKWWPFLVSVTTPTLSVFQVIVSPVLFVNSATKNLDFQQGVTPWTVLLCAVPQSSGDTTVNYYHTLMSHKLILPAINDHYCSRYQPQHERTPSHELMAQQRHPASPAMLKEDRSIQQKPNWLTKHITGHIGNDFYRSYDQTNSVKALKETSWSFR